MCPQIYTGEIDPDIARFLQGEVIKNKGEIWVAQFSISDRLTAFYYDVDPPQWQEGKVEHHRLMNQASGYLFFRVLGAGKLYGTLWTWTDMYHVHPPGIVSGIGEFWARDDTHGGIERQMDFLTTDSGYNACDWNSYNNVIEPELSKAGFAGRLGVLDTELHYWQWEH